MDIKMKTLLTIALILTASSAQAYLQACQLVAEKAGESYQVKPNRFASIVAPIDLPQSIATSGLIERNGIWFIYQADSELFEKQQCSPQQKNDIEIVPVLYNQTSGHNAVVNGVFMIKTHQEQDINLVANKYDIRKITQLPNRFTAIFDVKPQDSYDEFIEILSKDKDIEKLIPLLSEPRYRTR